MRVPIIRNVTVKLANQNGTAWVLDKTQTNAHVAFFYIECFCNAWFTFEILVSSTVNFASKHQIQLHFMLFIVSDTLYIVTQ